MNQKIATLLVAFFAGSGIISYSAEPGKSIYSLRPEDPEALFFTPDNFKITADGKTDLSGHIQSAINKLKTGSNFGIIFIPVGNKQPGRTFWFKAESVK